MVNGASHRVHVVLFYTKVLVSARVGCLDQYKASNARGFVLQWNIDLNQKICCIFVDFLEYGKCLGHNQLRCKECKHNKDLLVGQQQKCTNHKQTPS